MRLKNRSLPETNEKRSGEIAKELNRYSEKLIRKYSKGEIGSEEYERLAVLSGLKKVDGG